MPTRKRPTEEIADYMGKVTLVPNLSYLFSAGTIGAYRGARDSTLLPASSEDGFYPQQSRS